MKLLRTLFFALSVAVLSGCCYCQKYQRLYGRPLHETKWTLVQAAGRPVEKTYVLVMHKGGDMEITGEGSTIAARYLDNKSGGITIDNLKLTHGEGGDQQLEEMLVSQLGTTTNYKMDGKFVMMIRNGEMWALYEAKEPRGTKRYKPEPEEEPESEW